MAVENPVSLQQQGAVSRVLGVYFFIKNIFFALVFLAVIIFMFLAGVPWYFVIVFVLIGGFVIFSSIKKSLNAVRGFGSSPRTVTKYTIGKGFSTVERY